MSDRTILISRGPSLTILNKVLAAIAALLTFAALVIALYPHPHLGQIGRFAGQRITIGSSPALLELANGWRRVGSDESGVVLTRYHMSAFERSALEQQGSLLDVTAPITVQLLERDSAYAHIRITAGEHAGRAGWIGAALFTEDPQPLLSHESYARKIFGGP